MSIKKVHADNPENYVVNTEVESFNYTLDYVSKNPNKQSVGASPTGLLLSSLAGCQLMTTRSFFNRHHIQSTVLKADIIGDFIHNEEGWQLDADVVLKTDAELAEDQTEELKQFIEKYCTVSGVLSSGNNQINLIIEKV